MACGDPVDPAVTKSFIPSEPSVEVVSSPIGYDSGLFDRVRIRCRTVHDRPTEGSFSMEWDSASGHDYFSLGVEVPRQRIVYTPSGRKWRSRWMVNMDGRAC